MSLQELIRHLRSLEGKATRGPWRFIGSNSVSTMRGHYVASTHNKEDAELIASMRNSLPRILAAMEAQKAELDASRALLDWVRNGKGQAPREMIEAQLAARTALSKLEGEQ